MRRSLVLLGLVAGAVLAFRVTQAGAVVVGTAPTWPIPSDAPAGPPPIAAMPVAADAAPPGEQLADPVTPGATCGGWALQSNYGGLWPANSTWWEYRCTYDHSFYYNPCGGGACNAFCPQCYFEEETRTDYFYWNGADGVFYGEDYYYFFSYTEIADDFPPVETRAWWDAPTGTWYRLGPVPLTVAKQGKGFGQISSSPAGIDCGYTCEASFDARTVVTLDATPDAFSVFTGWSGDCTGTGDCQVTMDRARSVTGSFALKTFALTVSKQGDGAGTVTSSPAGISCGETCEAGFDAGTYVILSASPAPSSVFAGWSGDCSGTATCQVRVDQARSATATFKPDTPPTASFAASCWVLTCSFDASGSSDSDGSIASYAWTFGDGASGTGKTVSHTYARAGTYTVGVAVTDDRGVTGSQSQAVTPIGLSARGYKVSGLQKVDLSWNGPPSGASFEVYRDGVLIKTLTATAYTDPVNKRGPATYRYRACAPALSTCSNEATVSF